MADSATFPNPVDIKTIAIVRALGGLGDVLVAVPALAALRARFPAATIRYIGMPQTRAAVERFAGLIDDFEDFPGFPGVVEMPFRTANLIEYLAKRAGAAPDLAIQMHGSGGVTNGFVALLEARFSLGYHAPGAWVPSALSRPFPDALSERDRWLALVGSIGCVEVPEPRFPITSAECDAVAGLVPGAATAPLAVVHAGASDPRRRWPAERFATVADRLADTGFVVALTGTDSERAIVDRVRAAMTKPALDLCGKTSLGVAAALIERADLVVTNDTGTSHLAASLGTPSVVIFIASDPSRWAPADATRHRVVGRGVPDAVIGRAPPTTAGTMPPCADVIEAIESLLAVPA